MYLAALVVVYLSRRPRSAHGSLSQSAPGAVYMLYRSHDVRPCDGSRCMVHGDCASALRELVVRPAPVSGGEADLQSRNALAHWKAMWVAR